MKLCCLFVQFILQQAAWLPCFFTLCMLGGSMSDNARAALQVGKAHEGNRLPWTNGQVESNQSKGQPLTDEQVKQQLSTMAHETHQGG